MAGKKVQLKKKKYNSFTRFFASAKAKIKNLKWESTRLPAGTKSAKLSFDVEEAEGGEEPPSSSTGGSPRGQKR